MGFAPGESMLAALAPLAALPWLQGFFEPAASSELPSQEVVARLDRWAEPNEDCVAAAYGGLAVRANITDNEGSETVLASYTQGVFVVDHERNLIAQAPGFPCEGSADDLVAIAVGDAAIGSKVIVLAATSGGRTESSTWLSLYRVSNDGELQPVFIGEVERHEGHTTRTGTVTLIPGGLIYRDPGGFSSLWLYDPELGRYIERMTSRPYA